MSKQTFICPYDNKTEIIKIFNDSNSIYKQIQLNNSTKRLNPSKIFKFVKCNYNFENSNFKSLPNFDKLNYFYKANDVWEFENIGVSKPPSKTEKPEILSLLNLIDNKIHNFAIVRYLVCGHCDHGAFGFAAYHLDNDAIDEIDEIDQIVEIGYNFKSANPNHLNYFFYL